MMRFVMLLISSTILIGTVPTFAMGATGSKEIEHDRALIQEKVCSKKTLPELQAALTALSITYYVHENNRLLNAIRRYNEEKLVSTAITIQAGFDLDKKITSCEVRILHTGP
jgi:hypothetical protein